MRSSVASPSQRPAARPLRYSRSVAFQQAAISAAVSTRGPYRRTPTTCQPTSSANSNGCVSARYVDTNGDVLFYLTQVQNAAVAAANGR